MSELVVLIVTQDGMSPSAKRSIKLEIGKDSYRRVGSSRVSSLLPVYLPADRSVEIKAITEPKCIGFFFHAKPAIAARILLDAFNHELVSGTIFVALTLGRASVAISASHASVLEQIYETLRRKDSKSCHGYEWWELQGLRIMKSHQVDIDPIPCITHDLSELDGLLEEHEDLLLECYMSLAAIISHSEVYTPSMSSHFRALESELLVTREDMRSSLESENPDAVAHLRRLMSNLTELLASLSYVDSQWFSGISRVLGHPGQIRGNSLLGVGTACQGLAHTLVKASRLFTESGLEEAFGILLAEAPFYPLALATERSAHWNSSTLTGAHKRGHGSSNARIPLAHFSARRGWRETDYSLSAPEMSLRHGGAPAWHVRNITHEFLHMHVNILLGKLRFHVRCQIDRGVYDAHGNQIDDEFVIPELLGTPDSTVYDKSGTPIADAGTSLWAAVCHAALMMKVAESFVSPLSVRYEQALTQYDEELNEIIVQILDFFYFYGADAEEYLQGLWPAWSKVPAVYARLPYYLSRLICTLIAEHNFPSVANIDEAVSWLVEQFGSGTLRENHLSQKSLELLQSPAWGAYRSSIAQRIHAVSLAKTFFYSEGISTSTLDDYMLDKRGQYSLNPFEYKSEGIGNPFAFLRHLQRNFPAADRALSIWLYAQLASANFNEAELSEDVL